ncbi:MAG: pyridoxamine 5'-phosphate oxidase [Chitinophagales bacterium]|nr:pyridoxamine 5'-phosphate oxidase [Chitinophagales bacterium]MCZ2393745.1 pyridoxamine 5'-phosphate oxidase [Chitinophagales bacterium]
MSKKLADLRVKYGIKELEEQSCPESPMVLFEQWMNEAIECISFDANAMAISTVDYQNRPSSRMVLLKEIKDGHFIFFTHYDGKKGLQIEKNSHVALLFWWKELERQVRIEGIAHKISKSESEEYFHSRPRGSQIGALASHQSQATTKNALIENYGKLEEKFKNTAIIPLSDNWGGYAIEPQLIEFWQGRPNRMHDRVEYLLEDSIWTRRRLAP